MTEVVIESKVYPRYRYDEQLDCPTDEVVGYSVFSECWVGPYTRVRAVVENRTGRPASLTSKVWFVEWRIELERSPVTISLLSVDQPKQSFSVALRLARRAAELIGMQHFEQEDAVMQFVETHRDVLPIGPGNGRRA